MAIMRLLLLLLPLLAAVVSASPVSRFLEDEDEEGYNEDLSYFTVKQGSCFRVKIAGDNDDDGNSYFYNGAYRAQYSRYISFDLCSDSSGCSQYVMDLETYLEETVAYVQTLCNACSNQCRRRLEDGEEEENEGEDEGGEDDAEEEEEEEEYAVNCNTCASECSLLIKNGNSGDDESGYLDCQAVEDDGDDIQYYTAPQCENGAVVIGHFYDDECTIKTSTLQDRGFSYNTFQTISNLQLDCSTTETCADLAQNAVLCEDGYAGDQDDAKLCKAAKSAGRITNFYKKPFYKKVPLGFIVFLTFMLGTFFGFFSYTYYVRHLRLQQKTPLSEMDGADLPPVS